ncbi:hypothetical protein C8F01DRAFT_358891 [Mycena amicta]|nr:hypothetical protein C8F01DRAFT_358891 [Mycena amicta]
MTAHLLLRLPEAPAFASVVLTACCMDSEVPPSSVTREMAVTTTSTTPVPKRQRRPTTYSCYNLKNRIDFSLDAICAQAVLVSPLAPFKVRSPTVGLVFNLGMLPLSRCLISKIQLVVYSPTFNTPLTHT